MSETLTKKQWQEKKHSRFESKRRAAVSVQTARIIDKLLERSQDLSNGSHENRTNAITASNSFKGASENRPEATLTNSVINYNLGEKRDEIAISTHEHQVKPMFGKERTVKTARILRSSKDMLDSRTAYRQHDFDSEGKQKPTEQLEFSYTDRYSHNLSSGDVVRTAAPALYEVKKAIDEAEEHKSRKAA